MMKTLNLMHISCDLFVYFYLWHFFIISIRANLFMFRCIKPMHNCTYVDNVYNSWFHLTRKNNYTSSFCFLGFQRMVLLVSLVIKIIILVSTTFAPLFHTFRLTQNPTYSPPHIHPITHDVCCNYTNIFLRVCDCRQGGEIDTYGEYALSFEWHTFHVVCINFL